MVGPRYVGGAANPLFWANSHFSALQANAGANLNFVTSLHDTTLPSVLDTTRVALVAVEVVVGVPVVATGQCFGPDMTLGLGFAMGVPSFVLR